MKKKPNRPDPVSERDTMRPEYDFSKAVRGATAARYAEGAHIVAIDPAVLDVFPDGVAVNDALRALAPVLRQQLRRPRNGGASPKRTRPAARATRQS